MHLVIHLIPLVQVIQHLLLHQEYQRILMLLADPVHLVVQILQLSLPGQVHLALPVVPYHLCYQPDREYLNSQCLQVAQTDR